jgi:bacillithiol system protein YtxJ
MGLFSFGKKSTSGHQIDWVELTDHDQLTELLESSKEKPVVFFKHSTRCSISSMALSRLENHWDIDVENAMPVYLDLIRYRDLSNRLAEELHVTHQSPQVLLVKDGGCVFHASHNQIDVNGIKQQL